MSKIMVPPESLSQYLSNEYRVGLHALKELKGNTVCHNALQGFPKRFILKFPAETPVGRQESVNIYN
jgi:hypothetical protein